MDGFLDDLPDLDFPDPPKQWGGRLPARSQGDPDCVLWTRVRCPQCGSSDCPVVNSSHVPIRYHKCRQCGHSFKSIEKNWRGEEE
jgi:hypothetical protein